MREPWQKKRKILTFFTKKFIIIVKIEQQKGDFL